MIAPFYTHLCPFFIFCIKKDPVQRTGGDCQKAMECSFAAEPPGMSEGGKKPPSRLIKQRGEKAFSTRCPVQRTGQTIYSFS